MTRARASPERRTLAVAALVIAAGALSIFAEPAWLRPLANAGFDLWQRVAPREVVSLPATVVAIDERSIGALGRWPWPRTELAELVAAIERYRPAAIALDIFMPEPDPLSPERLLARVHEAAPEARSALASLPSHDSVLARVLAAGPTVLGVAGVPEPTGRRINVVPVALVDRNARDRADDALARLVHHAGALTSIPELDRAASGWGLISVDSEAGVIRRLPLVGSIEGTPIPGFGVEALRVALRVPAIRLFASGGSIDGVAIGDVFVPGEPDGTARLHFSHRNRERFVSAVDVLEHRVDPDRLAKAIVIVGITGLGLGEYHATPLGEPMPGSEIHAQLVENVVDGALLVRPAWASAAEAAAFVALGVALAFAIPLLPPRLGGAASVLCVAALLAVAYLAFRYERRVFDALTPAAGLVLLAGVLLFLTLSDAARQRRALERVLQAQREEGARMAGELEAARRIQTATLPTTGVVRGDPRLDLAVSMTPAREVGGDLYDFFWLDARRLFVIVGDVAGKGLSASIFMAVSKALCKSATLRTHATDIGALMTQANDEVSRDNPEMLFVTAFAAVLDVDNGDIAYCNAGHENPLVAGIGDAPLRRLDDGGGPPLCVLPELDYRGAHDGLRRGDVVCIVSDGITEAQDRGGALFGSARVGEVLLAARDANVDAQAIVDRLRDAVHAFTGDVEAADDATILVLRWIGPADASAPGSRPAG